MSKPEVGEIVYFHPSWYHEDKILAVVQRGGPNTVEYPVLVYLYETPSLTCPSTTPAVARLGLIGGLSPFEEWRVSRETFMWIEQIPGEEKDSAIEKIDRIKKEELAIHEAFLDGLEKQRAIAKQEEILRKQAWFYRLWNAFWGAVKGAIKGE